MKVLFSRIVVIGTVVAAANLVLQASGTTTLDVDDRTIVHVLNRVGFGPRPGDVDRVRRVGVRAYLEAQLHPERLDDSAAEAALNALATLTMRTADIAERFGRQLLEARRRARQRGADSETGVERQIDRQVRRESNTPLRELASQKVLRAAFSERQLQEVLTDFWFNHFNVDARKGPVRFLVTAYERDSIRPHVLGRFRDLLGATAKSPAMLFYLDNWMSAEPTIQTERGRRGRVPSHLATTAVGSSTNQAPRPPRGLNENYARELLELHTLGVDGGYTQADVTAVARAFTGWTIAGPRRGGDFWFNPAMHGTGPKQVLDHTIRRGGVDDGEEVLDIVARHPATARHLATKLVRRFVDDHPPPALVDRTAARFLATDGDLREVVRTIVTAPEFLAATARGSKTKSPFEFLTSAVRAVGARTLDPVWFVERAQVLGMPLYQCQPPTGYGDTAETWTNAGALVARLNAAHDLASTVAVDGRDDPSAVVIKAGLAGQLADATLATIARASGPVERLALTLGSPEFQKR